MMAKLCDVKMVRPQLVIYVPPYIFEMLCTILFVKDHGMKLKYIDLLFI